MTDNEDREQEKLAGQLLDIAGKNGAEAAEVFSERSRSLSAAFEANRLKELTNSSSAGTALRLWVDGRPGLAVAYGPVDPGALVERAIALSHLNPPGRIELADNGGTDVEGNMGKYVAAEQLVAWGQEAIGRVREAYPEVICNSEWDCEIETTSIINSQGLNCSYTDTTVNCYLESEWVRGEDFLGVSEGQTQRDCLDPKLIANTLLQRLDWAKANVLPPTGRVAVLFTAKAADLFWGIISSALNGKRVVEKASPWSDRLGERVISTHLTLYQQPDIGPYSCPFDDEGTIAQPLVFIQNGILENFYADRTIGRLLGKGTTGNGFRPGLGSYPTPGLFNLLIKPGTGRLSDLITQLEDGLIVDQMLGDAAGISGEFSINVDLGYLVRDGQIVGRVKDTMVAGNVYQALKQLVALGGDAEWNGSCYTPSLIVDGLSVTGKTD